MTTTDSHRGAIDPRILLPILSVVLFAPVLTIYWPASHGLDVTDHQIGRDFINAWSGPQLAFSGRLSVLFDFDAYHAAISALFGAPLPFHSWSYPLFALFIYWPFAQLPYFAALMVWTIGLFAVFATITLSQIERPARPFALVLLALAPASLINIVGGQNGFLTATLLLGGMLLLDRRPVLAGILFGLLTYKPQLGLVLPFVLLALGAWRAIFAATATATVLIAASFAVFGLEAWQSYFEVTSAFQVRILERMTDFGVLMLTSVMMGARTFGVPLQAALMIQVAVAIPVVAIAAFAVQQTADPSKRAFVLVAATLLATPYALVYDFPALAAVIAWRLCAPQPLGAGRTVLLLLAWLVPLGAMYLNSFGLGVAPLAVLGVFALAVRDAVGVRAASPFGNPFRRVAIPAAPLPQR